MISVLTDLRFAARGLRRAPGFAVAATLVLGLGIGVNVAVFTVANAALFKGFRGIADQAARQLVDTAPSDLLTLTGIAGLIAATALVGCLVPARRATRIDPLVALRQD